MRTLRTETEYLCDLARAWASGVRGVVPAPASLDAARFVRMFAGQQAMQTMAQHLDRTALPADQLAMLDRTVDIARRRTTMMLLELERLLHGLGAVGIRPVVLKGGSLAMTTYAVPQDRWFVDLDLLVRPEEQAAAYETLLGMGYRFAESDTAREYYRKYHFHRVLLSAQGVCVELHWAVTMPRSTYRYDLEAMRAGTSEVTLGEVALLAPHPVDQALHGVLQSIPCAYTDLRRILDLHLLDARLDDADRQHLCDRAHWSNLATGLWLQYRLREEILGAAMPSLVAHQCRPCPSLVRVFERLDLASGCLERDLEDVHALSRLVHWLCVPSSNRGRELRRFLLPSEEVRLQTELEWGRRVTLLNTPWLMAQRTLTTLRMAGRLARAVL
jgi:hypothetical protein